MQGRSIEALDDLIRAWSRWDEYEQYYLEDLAPRIARSDDPDFSWLDLEQQRHGRRSGPTERMIAVRLKELMSPDEWQVLPELIRARRGLELHELESDAERRARIAGREAAARDAEQARRDAERERRETEDWPDAFDRARQEGEARLAREEEERAAAREAEEQARLDRAAEVARRREEARRAQRERQERDRREAEERSRRDQEEHQARREAEKQAALDEAGRADHEETDLERRDEEAEPPPNGAREAAPRSPRPASRHEGGSIEDGELGTYRVEREGAASSAAAPPPAQEDAMSNDRHDDAELEARLQELAELADEGLISPEEYAERRERVAATGAEAAEALTAANASNDADEASNDEDDGTDTADAPGAGEPDEFPAVDDDAEDDGASDDEPPTDEDAQVDALSQTPGGVTRDLRGYARRLTGRGEEGLADAVREYAERVRGVERGELPAVLSVAPAAIAPEMVGAALVRRRLEGFLEFFRNVLIFMPVLWTWLKLQAAVDAYTPGPEQNFFDFWVETGSSHWLLGGPLTHAALQVAVVLVLLVVVNSLLGILSGRTERRREREARSFAAVLARAEAAGAAHRAEDPQSALAGFAVAATGLTTELRSVGEGLQRSATPFAESVELARQALTETSGAVASQQRRLDDVIEQLRGIAGMGDQLGALRAEFSEAREAAERSAEALTGIRDSLDPSARDFADAAGTLAQLATHLERMTDAMAGTIAALDGGLDSTAEHLRDAAMSMNTVATRVLDELGDGRSAGR
ncbi:MAG: hypothetical protein F4056_06890 [Chloroflexi bacterium]|nr:hypothetical protein [Chloroflexota bacterium]